MITNQPDSTPPSRRRTKKPRPSPTTVEFFKSEVAAGRMAKNLGPMQVGIGNIANAVMCGLIDSPFEDTVMYSEVLQDCTFELIDAGKMTLLPVAPSPSERCNDRVFGNRRSTRTSWCCVRRKSPTIRSWCAVSASSASTPRWSSTSTVTSTHPRGRHQDDEWYRWFGRLRA